MLLSFMSEFVLGQELYKDDTIQVNFRYNDVQRRFELEIQNNLDKPVVLRMNKLLMYKDRDDTSYILNNNMVNNGISSLPISDQEELNLVTLDKHDIIIFVSDSTSEKITQNDFRAYLMVDYLVLKEDFIFASKIRLRSLNYFLEEHNYYINRLKAEVKFESNSACFLYPMIEKIYTKRI